MDSYSEHLQIKLVQQPGCQYATVRPLQTTLAPSQICPVRPRHLCTGAKLTKFRRLSSCTPSEPRAQMVGYMCESYAQTMAKTPGCQRESRITVHCSLATAQSASEQSPMVQARLRRATTRRRGNARRRAGAAAPRLSATHTGRPLRRRWRRGALTQKRAHRAPKSAARRVRSAARQRAPIAAIGPNRHAVFD